MDFQKIADSLGAMTCIVSVEKLDNGRYGKVRLVAGNKAYIDSIEHPAPGVEMLSQKFIPNSEYTAYLTRDLNFEEACYRAAVEKKCIHSYAHPDRLDVWFNMTFLPLLPDDGNICYCTYTMEINLTPSSERMSEVSSDVGTAVVEACITLRNNSDFKEGMNKVITNIRELCKSEYSCILLMDTYEKSCSVLCESFDPDSKLTPQENYLNDFFYPIAESWEDTIAGSNCLIAKNEQDMEVVEERNPTWYHSLKESGIKTIVLFPLKTREGQLLGYIWSVNFQPDESPKIKETLEITSFVLAAEINNYLLLNRLKILSSRDMLTGVMNRNEMNIYVDKLSKGNQETSNSNSVGVIFTDLNGLKNVNDTEGHSAGDKLLKDASKALCEIFDSDDIYRAGGDEFTIILTGISKEDLAHKASQIKSISPKYDKLIFAVGYSYDDDIKNIRQVLAQADSEMYKDKAEYYRLHPDARHM
ncbi:MAG: GGDEF domain-containing protein [Eubacterium sp.]|nr:GGDEF domain-containing protein [Eubacterium sp.]